MAGGRPKGAKSSISHESRLAAQATGLLPHEWLLKVSRGEGIEHKRREIIHNINGVVISDKVVTEIIYADFETRVDAAKAAAPFYAPKLATQIVSLNNNIEAVNDTLKALADKLPV